METRPPAVVDGNPRQFISHKELATAYNVTPRQLTKELEKIEQRAKWKRRKHQVLYAPVELKTIFSHLGNPFAV